MLKKITIRKYKLERGGKVTNSHSLLSILITLHYKGNIQSPPFISLVLHGK